ncbi:acetylglutamate kinase, chloroplastic [Tanacetum coccineum]
MEIVSMVLVGKVNKHLVGLINKAGGTAVGLCGTDGRIFTAIPSPNADKLGFVGEISSVDTSVLRTLVSDNLIPVIASVAADGTGQSYNINADTAAGELASALGAEKLLLLTDVAGILEDKEDVGSLVKEIDVKGVRKMMDDGKIAGGMIPKVNCCVKALANGVKTASIIDGRLEHSLLLEVLTDGGAGTMITGKRIFKRRYKKKAKSKQNRARSGKDQVKSKSKVNPLKKIQLEGLKLPKPQVVLLIQQDKGQNCKEGKDCIQVIQLEGTKAAYFPKSPLSRPTKTQDNLYVAPYFSPAKPLNTLAKIISSTLLIPPQLYKVHVGNPSPFPSFFNG